ncbi:hypothetical protein O6H91_20G007400 [Diphasiastrum complanatum]|uniref:Uncharacterized protein n=1 Tax=Diphasiastrum complanatum TaxID=34168 RepID=A0ACC2AMH7_DIPCM|nr:hypothetical protein O6H91_20G007400 [Diphasiastrum complanatum]
MDKTAASRLRWSKEETLMLVAAKKRHLDSLLAHKWKAISDCLRAQGVDRDPVGCKKRWFNLVAEYKKIRDWQTMRGVESFWVMAAERRREKRLPSAFDRDVFEELDSWLGCRPAISPVTILDSGVTSADGNQESVVEDDDLLQDVFGKDSSAAAAAPSESDNLHSMKMDGKCGKKRKPPTAEVSAAKDQLIQMAEAFDVKERLVQILEKNGQGIEVALRDNCQAQIDAQNQISEAQIDTQRQIIEVQKEFVGAMYAMVGVLGELAKSLRPQQEQ